MKKCDEMRLPFVKSGWGANNVSNLIGFEPCAHHDAESDSEDHRYVALIEK
jgi:hypothetical protein